ncbi:hypothetical protein [Parapedobacter indicus]|uniref:Uncharacterized protein n=1 Tax=Parapedobacter indicus TaxID=1477437 RepID=A0A1I3E1E2_9SPHI|nr:hypothetical protein [Parapedobacter indicus]PPL04924.1 hypothetical protein CLV26_101734 [Parapedobacter indicus]SFH92658.1 hypothetical protein SAMN05444682_101720 [Parapedobacter indicus]
MTQFEIEKVMTGMRGKIYRYKNERHHVLRFAITHVVKITTDRADITILMEDFDQVIQTFDEVKEMEALQVTNATGLQHQTVINSSGLELKNTLLDTISRLKRDKDFVPQASAINDAVKTIIDLAKVEVEMIKVMRGK